MGKRSVCLENVRNTDVFMAKFVLVSFWKVKQTNMYSVSFINKLKIRTIQALNNLEQCKHPIG